MELKGGEVISGDAWDLYACAAMHADAWISFKLELNHSSKLPNIGM